MKDTMLGGHSLPEGTQVFAVSVILIVIFSVKKNCVGIKDSYILGGLLGPRTVRVSGAAETE